VDCAPGIALEARVEQSRRVLQRGPLEERKFHDVLVRLAGADRTFVRPHRNSWMRRLSPLPLLDHFRVGLFDKGAKPGEGLAPPVAQFLDPGVYQLRWRLDLLRGALLHVVDLPLPSSYIVPIYWVKSELVLGHYRACEGRRPVSAVSLSVRCPISTSCLTTRSSGCVASTSW